MLTEKQIADAIKSEFAKIEARIAPRLVWARTHYVMSCAAFFALGFGLAHLI